MTKSLACATLALFTLTTSALADTFTFFDASQSPTVTEATTSTTYTIDGYKFVCTRDKLFTGGTGQVIGRTLRVPFPDGLEAQAVTEGAPTSGGRLTISRLDNSLFDISELTLKLLANTAGAGGNFEVTPKLNGEDVPNAPFMLFGSGNYSQSFTFNDNTPAYLGNTLPLKQAQSYTIAIYVDFALTSLTLEGNPVPEPTSLLLLTPAAGLLLRRKRT